MPHRAIPGFFRDAEYARFDAEQVLLQHSSTSWDALTLELWPALLTGGRCVLYAGQSLDPEELAREVERHGVTTLWLTAALFNLIVDTRPALLDVVRQVMTGGEAVSVPHLRRARERNPGLRLVNGYGPSECTVFTSCHVVGEAVAEGEVLPIGRPVGDRRVYVLDAWGEPAPVGVPGELHVGGAAVARGYLGQAELTAQKFVPDALGSVPGARLYASGDRVRWLPTGELEFLGRVDAQVKIRGFRIELGEVEAVLAAVPAVRESAVVVREDAPGQKRLVAYFVPRQGIEVSTGELRAQLSARLPEYLVPSAFVALDSLPLTPNGKLDRRALPAPAYGSAEDRYVAPRTPVEEVLAGIWSEVLGTERVGVEDSFFELGGHSLLATQVVSRARQAFGVEVPLRALFEAPTVAGLAERIEALRSAGTSSAPAIERVSREGPLPVSFAQQRLWVVDRLEPGSAAYNMPFALRLRGMLDAAALRASLDALVWRHETLRTTFAEQGGVPVQVIHPAAPVALRELDLRNLPEADREAEAERLASQETLLPFDLANGPLLRSTLVRVGEEEHVLLFTLHHVVSDGWSMQVLVREISALYGAFSRGEESQLAELPVQYTDFAVWQREWLSGEVLDAQIDFWRERLGGAPPLLEIPTDHPRGLGQSPLAETHSFILSAELSEELRALSRREGATLFMTVLAGWQALLGRYAGQDDVVVGSPIAGRNRHEVEGLIGFFVNMLSLRADLAGDPTWTELLGRTRATALGAYEHQDLPFERLVEELGAERSLTHTPVFQVTFALQKAGAEGQLSLGELELEPFESGAGVAKFDLELAFVDEPETLAATLAYRGALFEAQTVARMAGHLEVLLGAMSAEPGRRLSEVSLLRGAERVQVLEAWNATAAELPRACVHELFAEQAGRTPTATAVLFADEVLTYAELERRANRLAHLLRQRGVGRETRVGMVLERGVDAVLAMLGILKAGGAYVPLAPSNPAERLREVFADAGVSLVLTDAAAGAQLPAEVEALWLDDAATVDALAVLPDSVPQGVSHPGQLAYVIYTSGSTGRPKGVAVAHESVVRLVRSTSYVPFGPTERIAHASNLAFDAATFEIWGALLNGGSLAVFEREVTLSPADFAAALREREVSALFLTTALFNRIAADEPQAFAGLRHLLFGGEAVDPQSVRRVLETGAPGRLLHVYGPTETTTYASWQHVRGVEAEAATVPIGGPLGNTTLYVLDAGGEALPAGVPGELYIGGLGVARGYLGQAAMTAERFVPDAFGTAGARLYRTGDRVRWTAAGQIEYLGRMDAQVKIRGFRIEPGEVEAVLSGLGEVGEAFVMVREDAPGQKRLAAYLVPVEGAELSTAELRARLAARLPDYMVPGAFVVLERLPLNANGKVDRRALPAPEQGAEAGYVAPRTPTEELLAGIWAEVLRLERVGAEDSFFELGGHSLLATQVVSRAREAFGVEVPLRTLFEAPTVAGLAERIEALRSTGTSSAPPMERVARQEPLPLSFAQQRLWLMDRMEPGSAAYNMPFALRLRGALETAALRASLDALVRRHETLRTVFTEQGGVPVQVVHPAAPVALLDLDLRSLPGEARAREVERLAGDEALLPFDLARGPLLRSTLVRVGDDEHVLLFTLHHVVGDGWSMQVLVREVSALYGAFSRGEEPHLPELPVQYADFAVWQRAWLAGDVLEAQIGYWKHALAGAPPLLEIPTDRPRTPAPSPRAEIHHFTLTAGLSDGLRALSRREGATLFMTVLAAWQALLGRYAGQADVVVGSPVAGRTRVETEGLIGFFVNMLALRADLGGDPTWRGLLERVREEALGAYAHQDLPFERLVEALEVERSLAHAPVFQVTFDLDRSAAHEGLTLGELASEPFRVGEGVAKFDLDLALHDTGDALEGTLAYRADLFEAATIERMAGHLAVLLGEMGADSTRRLSELSLLRGAERAQVLHLWNATGADYPDLCVHELVSAQAARTPDAPAVVFEGASLSYAALETGANRLAHLLRRRGVGPEVRVGISMEKGPEMALGVLAVLKAGGAYVPLDPAHPAERIGHMLRDSDTALLLTQAHLAERFPQGGVPVLAVDALRAELAAEPAGAPESGVSAENLAYVIYTSGSTGTPKGVAVPHRGVVNLATDMAVRLGLGANDRLLQFASLSFDVSVEEIFTAWSVGAAVVLSRGELFAPGALLELVSRERITSFELPSAFWHEWVRELVERGHPMPRSVRFVRVGGERVSPERLREWAGLGVPLVHVYGVTEASCTSAALRLGAGEDTGERVSLPIGRPTGNVRLYVLDGAGEPLPAGVPGEMYIGGAGLARGYLGRAELTAERFVPDPFGGEEGGRLYRSGDRARWLGEGTMEFLGRMDAQVKVRGFRIEPGEIEAVLLAYPRVREAAVVVRADVQRLVAYVVPEEGAEVTAAELRGHLAGRLPEYMVPGAFVTLAQLPLNVSGKVDRRALPAPKWGAEGAYVAPRTPTEEVLAGIWGEVLGTERVSVEEGFFELGGHSLLATQVVSRARQAFGVEVPMRALFEAPTVAGLAGRIEALRSAGTSAAPPMERVAREARSPLPVSFAQQRLWVVDRLEPGSAAYNMPFALRLRGALDTAALRASLDALVRRHETLRTTFAEQGGVPVQVIHPAAPVTPGELDLRGLPRAQREAEGERLASAEALRPFDLARGPLLRSTLVRLGEEEHVLLLTLHHVVSDGWSMQVLVREFSALYAAFSRAEEAHLPELPVQYADFTVWQRARLAGDVLDAHIGYWKNALAGAPPLLEIPTDRPRTLAQSPRAGIHRFALPAEVSQGLRALSRRERATLFMTTLAAWQALLGRYAGQDDVVVGSPIAGRTRRETEGLIGFFVNMLALRGDLGGDPTWRGLLERVREEALGAYAHQDLPFERLVEALDVERSLTHAPVFQVTFDLDRSAAHEELALGELAAEPFRTGEGTARFDLDLALHDSGDALEGTLTYRAGLFEAATITRMAGHLEALLEAMAAAPLRRAADAPLLRGPEREQVLDAWNATSADFPRERCIHELVADQAARTPEAVAVAAGGATLTFAELERRSARLAHRLAGLGAGPEARVGLCLERGPDMVVALLAVLRAGAAYLPLDPSYPAERLAYMLADSGASVLLVHSHLAAALPAFAGVRLCLDAGDAAAPAGAPSTPPPGAVDARGAAYVIYTSGSTGTPKGVVVPHRAVVNFLDSMRLRPGLTSRDTLLAVTTLSFDIAALELFLPLSVGARVVVADRETASDGARLREAIAASGATAMQATPASWRMLLEAGWEGAPGLKALCGGEALPRELAERLLPRVGELWNLYGPTETTIWSSVERVESGAGAVPIGGPIANTQLYLLEAGLEPVPVGVPGELFIGGEGVTRGYLGRPELTAERFVPDAFAREPGSGARLYRTGDRVRRRADGRLEYLGRTDQQVKVRGFRIELGEIEAALRAQAQVREAVAVVREGAPGDRRLVAYVVAEDGAPVTAAELRAALRDRLPEHMVPGALVVLESVPLTANGKIDRRALPAPELESAYVAPRTAAEEVLAGIWGEVLGVERVGAEDGFFDLGGHSLLATQVVSRARQALGVEVPLRALFEAPTVAGLAGRIEALRSAGAGAAPPMERVPREAGSALPVSFAQQRLWLVDRLEPGSAAYNMPGALRLRGALDVAALRAGLDALARRHETLRTVFAEQDGAPVQVIRPPAPVPLPTVELRGLPQARREAEAERLAAEEALRPFDLARGPLLRSTLLRLDDDDHVLCFTLHHVVSDGWSMLVLVREVSALYAALGRGEEPQLPELPLQYADFAAWQRAWMSGETLEAQLAYWRERLAGAPPLLEIPTDRPRAARTSPRAASHAFVLPADTAEGLRALSRREGTTLFMTTLAAWQMLLGRYAGEEEVVVGSPIAGRTRRETEGLIGFFVNMLVLRADLAGDPSWTELLGRVREAALGAYEHQDLPFERLVEELAVERSLAHSPVFQVTFALDRPGAGEALSLDGLAIERFGGGEGISKFDLELSLAETDAGMGGALVYRPALFDPETIARMVGHLDAVLAAMAAEPSRRLSDVPLLRSAERSRLLEEWSAAAPPVWPGFIHDLVAAQAERTPGAVAAVFEGEPLTYAGLEAGANRLANHLRRLGVGPETRVGVCAERSLELVVALLGTIRAGGAYVPLDPSYPAERLSYMLRDSGVRVLLTQEQLLERLPGTGAEVVCLDRDRERIAAESADPPSAMLDPDGLAYVIYTSGSTGAPKGVQVSHRGLAHSTAARFARYPEPVHGFLLLSSVSFDSSVAGIFWTLCSGGSLHLPLTEALHDPARLVETAARGRISHVLCVPSLYAALLDEAQRRPGWEPAVAIVAGEECPRGLVERHFGLFPRTALYNEYGPTEGTVWCTVHACRRDDASRRVPIGRPVPGTRVYVLDGTGGPAPAGIVGEVHVGGGGVARGYLGRPELTAEKFVPDPFSPEPGARLYRTGDRARWRPDGEMEFLGRFDAQVKVRGFRIELGEIEAALRGHPAVREAAVVVREEQAGRRRLVAYGVVEEGADASTSGLRSYLAARLPEYMVPSAFVVMDALPLNANGKVDRRALPAPEAGGEAESVAPRTVVEELLCGIWAEVLGVERVGVEDDFFALGGHSLLATQVVSRARQAFGTEVPLRALFECPTVAELAQRVEALVRGGSGPEAPPLAPVARDGSPLPPSFAQQRLWFIDQLEPGGAMYNMPLAMRLRGNLRLPLLERALTEIVRRHEALRTVFPSLDGEPAQLVRAAAPVRIPTADLRGLGAECGEAEALRLAREEAARPFDLVAGPLVRAAALRLDEAEWAVLFTLHHIVFDGWSAGVLVREVSELYTAFSRGEEPRLPELPVQYADYAAWQRAWLAGPVLEAQLAWWRERLAGAPPLLELPTDRPRPQVQDGHGATVELALPAELTRRLEALSRREGATLFMTLLAGLQVLLGRYAGQDDVVVGSPIANRLRVETEGLIGFFVNTLVLRTDLADDPSVRGLLGRVREATLGAYAHQELPFERLVEELAPERSLAHSPLFQVLLVLQNAGAGELRLGSAEAEPLGVGAEPAKFDLTFALGAGERVAGSVQFRTSLWERASIERMVEHLGAVLRAMAADPEARISGIELLGGAERAQLLHGWNATQAEYETAGGLAALFEAQAARTPQAQAVVFGERSLSYAELERESGRLAQRLRELGAGPEARVGLCVERSLEMVVGVLATLRAGAAYVPLDPAYPAERLAYMLEDSACRVLLTQERLLARLPEHGAETVLLDRPLDAEGAGALSHPPFPENLAYVIYTSGSTGRPKGVAMTQRPLLNLVDWQLREWSGRPAARVLQFSSISFDVSFQEMFSTWSSGGTLVVIPEETRTDMAALARVLERERIERIFLPFVALQHLAEAALEQGVAAGALREIVTAGEQLRVTEPIRRWLAAVPGRELVNQYGPSETHVVSSLTLAGEPAGWPALPGIGGPIANTQLYVLDASLRPVPVGVPGELYLGGDNVARGYLDRPGLTAERFVPDPFAARPGMRLYRPGDRARWLSGGGVEFLGRADQQVKVRGFRIEPGEVEAAMESHPAVRRALVHALEDAPGERRLVGYVVPEEGVEAPGAAELRSYLGGRLPEYMLPAAVVVLEAFPLTPSGKIDRRALPAPGAWESGAYVAPRTPAEEVLAGIYAQVLRLERVGAREGFFELGGHSLLATQVVSRVRQALGVELPLRTLFEAPTVAELATRVDALRSAGAGAAPPIGRVSREGPLPLSFAQQRLWIVDRLEPGGIAYNMPYALRLRGPLDVGALRASLDALVRRHETLRTVFAERDGAPVQVIRTPAPVPLPVLDLRGLPEAERQAAAGRLADEDAGRPFELERGPLLRSMLLRLDGDDHVLCFTLHHVVTDGWSMDVLVREVSALYAAFSRGESPRLPALPVQYADFAVWQREWLGGATLEAQVGYWKRELAGAPPVLEIPTDRPRSAAMGTRAGSHSFSLPADTAAGLRTLSRREGATLFMTLLAAWQSLLGRYAGQDDVVVGTPIAGRNRRETEGLIGFFVNMLPLRADLGGDPAWTGLLRRVRSSALGAYDHQDLPFERLVEELAVERSLTHTPVFQAIFALRKPDGEERLSLGDVRLEPVAAGAGATKFDLSLNMVDGEEGVGGTLLYRAGLFEADTAARMAGHLETLLEAMASHPQQRLSEASLLRGPERAHLLHAWNGADTGYTGELCVHELVRAQVLRTPDAPALRFQGQSLTYAELYARACRLANLLRRQGVGPEVRVGICMDPALEMVVSVLGVLLAGGAYLPLDPELPAERRAYVLGDAAPALLLTQAALAERLEDWGVPLLRVDAEAERIARESDEAPAAGVDPDNLAYVIYTSGSTGRPKGVLCEHRGVGNTFLELGRVYGAAPGERNLAYAPLFFDASVADIFVALCSGAELVLAPREAMMPGEDLARLLGQERITHLKIMPSALAVTPVEPLPELRTIVTGGEVLAAELVKRWGAGRRFFNGYGATEAGIRMTSSAYSWEGGDPPIGRAVANTQLYVLDAQLEPVPTGVPGELYIGGVGMARGYLGRPELTAERFVPDPHRGVAGARLYRTGDVGRRRADGEIDFLGRTDHQVKVRGYRVELGEIEATLRTHEQVKEAVVLLREDVPGQQRLVAYVTAEAGAELAPAELRTHVAEQVPEYMVPGALVVMERLPVTANGKVDRRALPVPQLGGVAEYEAPTTEMEELLCEIWLDVLGGGHAGGPERVGIHDNFFDLGGHSLLATQVVARLRQELKIDLPLRALFEAPTVAALATRVEELFIMTLDAADLAERLNAGGQEGGRGNA